MPLMHSDSKAAFDHNVGVESQTKPHKQALAIAFSEQRAAEHHKEALGMHHAMEHEKGKAEHAARTAKMHGHMMMKKKGY